MGGRLRGLGDLLRGNQVVGIRQNGSVQWWASCTVGGEFGKGGAELEMHDGEAGCKICLRLGVSKIRRRLSVNAMRENPVSGHACEATVVSGRRCG